MDLRLLVPVLWTIIATAIGLVLYRISSTKISTKAVRVTGGAAIAALAFVGLYLATPRSLLEPQSRTSLGRLNDLIVQQNDVLHRALGTCVDQGRREDACQATLEQALDAALEMASLIGELSRGN